MTPVIAVLAHGEATHVDHATKIRIERAFARAHELRLEPDGYVVILFMAGVGKNKSTRTLAERMALYAREYIERKKIDEHTLRLHYNQHDAKVWGTLEEVRWAHDEAHKLYRCPYIEYVTNKRHGSRVTHIASMLDHPKPYVITSGDAPPPFLHEIGGYLVLATYPIRPLYRQLQFLRRAIYSGG